MQVQVKCDNCGKENIFEIDHEMEANEIQFCPCCGGELENEVEFLGVPSVEFE